MRPVRRWLFAGEEEEEDEQEAEEQEEAEEEEEEEEEEGLARAEGVIASSCRKAQDNVCIW